MSTPPTPWPHVIRGAETLERRFAVDNLDRQTAEVVYGGGKTAMAALLIARMRQHYPELPVLCAVPTDALRSQFIYEFEKWGVAGAVEVRGTRTKPFDIASVPAVLTYSTLDRLVKNGDVPRSWRQGLMILDEGHHGPANRLASNLQVLEPRFLLGMTATPYRADGKILRDLLGSITFQYLADDAIRDGHIREVKTIVHGLAVPKKDQLLWRDIATARSINRTPTDNAKLFIDLVREHMAAPQIIGYTGSHEQSQEYARLIGELGYPDKIGIWDSAVPAETNRTTLARYKNGEIGLLLTVNMADEGLNVPDTTGVVMFDTTTSLRRYVQRIGRAARKGPDAERYAFDLGASIKFIASGPRGMPDFSDEFDLAVDSGLDFEIPEVTEPRRPTSTRPERAPGSKADPGQFPDTGVLFDASRVQRAADWTPQRILLGVAKSGLEPKLIGPSLIGKFWGFLPSEGVIRSIWGNPDLLARASGRMMGKPAYREPEEFEAVIGDRIGTAELDEMFLMQAGYLFDPDLRLPFSADLVRHVFGGTAHFYRAMRHAHGTDGEALYLGLTQGGIDPRSVTADEALDAARYAIHSGIAAPFSGDDSSMTAQWKALNLNISTISLRNMLGASQVELPDWWVMRRRLFEVVNSEPMAADENISPADLVVRIAERMIEHGSREAPTVAWLSREGLSDRTFALERVSQVFRNHFGHTGLRFALARTLDVRLARDPTEMRQRAERFVTMLAELDNISRSFVPDGSQEVLGEINLSSLALTATQGVGHGSSSTERDFVRRGSVSTQRDQPVSGSRVGTSLVAVPASLIDERELDEKESLPSVSVADVPLLMSAIRAPVPKGASQVNVTYVPPHPEWHGADSPDRLTHITPRVGVLLVTPRDQLLLIGDYPERMVAKSIVSGRVGTIPNEAIDRLLDTQLAAVVAARGTISHGQLYRPWQPTKEMISILDTLQTQLGDVARLTAVANESGNPEDQERLGYQLRSVRYLLKNEGSALGSQVEPPLAAAQSFSEGKITGDFPGLP